MLFSSNETTITALQFVTAVLGYVIIVAVMQVVIILTRHQRVFKATKLKPEHTSQNVIFSMKNAQEHHYRYSAY